MLSIDAVYIPLRQPPTPAVVRTKMNITEMHDTIPIKLLWQIWYIHRKLLYFHLWKAQGKAINEREKRTHRQYQSYEFSPVSALIAGTESKSAQLTTFSDTHAQPADKAAEGKDKLGHCKYRHHSKPDINQYRVVGKEITLQSEKAAIPDDSHCRQPPQKT